MINRPDTRSQRLKRHKRVRAKISGTPERPRLNVFRSETNIYAQIIDDVAGVTLVSAGEESAFELKRLLKAQGLRGPEDRRGEASFYVSDTPENFEEMASLFLRENLHHAARRINIDEY